MNIFFVDKNPVQAAQALCDKHVFKMCVESCQLMSTAHWHINSDLCSDWRIDDESHTNHPCAIWVRESAENYEWLHEHAVALLDEYELRYEKTNEWMRAKLKVLNRPSATRTGFTLPPLVMPIEYKVDVITLDEVVQAYRAMYLGTKAGFARWGKCRPMPGWWHPATGGTATV